MCLIPTSFCSDEVVGSRTHLTGERLKQIRRSVHFTLIFSAFSPCAELPSVSSGLGWVFRASGSAAALLWVLLGGVELSFVVPLPAATWAAYVGVCPVVRVS